MSDTTDATSLLQQLDTRQDEVLDQLVELNQRIEGLLKDCESWRHADFVPADDVE